MFNIGTGEMIMIAVVALLVLGPTRLPELARGIGKFIREFRRQTDDVRNVVEREFYRMDQEVMNPNPQPAVTQQPLQIQAPPDAVAQGQQLPEHLQHAGEQPPPPAQEELALHPPAMDESDPGHPDYNREEKPADESPSPPPDAPSQKVG